MHLALNENLYENHYRFSLTINYVHTCITYSSKSNGLAEIEYMFFLRGNCALKMLNIYIIRRIIRLRRRVVASSWHIYDAGPRRHHEGHSTTEGCSVVGGIFMMLDHDTSCLELDSLVCREFATGLNFFRIWS